MTSKVIKGRCGKCNGNLAAETDMHGTYVRCIMCSRTVEITQEYPLVSGSGISSLREPAPPLVSSSRACILRATMMSDSGDPW